MTRTVHIIGAGLAGLSAALKLSRGGERVVVHEATAFAGGRCRSYHDASVGMTIDNGNHLLLSGNRAALDYLRDIGAERRLIGPAAAEFPFVDLASRRTLDAALQRRPRAVVDFRFRPPGARHARARLCGAGCGCCGRRRTRRSAISSPAKARSIGGWSSRCLLAALNIDPPQGSAKLAAAVIRETLAAGGRACRPLIARDGLSATLIEPALAMLQQRGAAVRFEHQLRAFRFGTERVDALDFGAETSPLDADDAVILAVPPYAAASLVSGLERADRVSRHRQRAFSHRTAGGSAADPRRAQRHGRMDFRLSRPAVGHGQRRRSIDRYAAGGTGKDDLGGGGERDRVAGTSCRLGRSCASAAPPLPRRRRRI